MEDELPTLEINPPSVNESDKKMEKLSLPEGIGQYEDSGFASIAGSVITENEETSKLPENPPVFVTRADRERVRLEQLAVKRQAELQHENEKREKVYKRLMHLLKQSKFFSDFLMKKLSNNEAKPSTSKSSKRKIQDSDDEPIYTPPSKRPKRNCKPVQKDLKESLRPQRQKRLTETGKRKLTEKQIQTELDAIVDEEDETSEESFSQPKYFQGDLRDYQKHGLQWLKALYEHGMSGILADEMGLGKTVQVIAMIAHLIEKHQPGPFLIVTPLSTIPNWLMEFERFAPKIPVVLFYGSSGERAQQAVKVKKTVSVDGFRTLPVVLTTYETPIKNQRLVKGLNWRYIIIDEAQRIKNAECQLVQLLKTCKSDNRLLLTGTPLQNNLKELWSLLHFLMPQIFSDLAVFESWFDVRDFQHEEGTNRILQQEEEKKVLQSLREILKPFMLRRMKTDVCLDIPAKKEVMVYAPMSSLQRQLYTAYLSRDICTLSKTKPEPIILDDEFGKRPKRSCAVNNRYSDAYRNLDQALANGWNTSASSEDDTHSSSLDPDYVASSDFSHRDNNPESTVETKAVGKEVSPPSKTAAVDKVMEKWTDHVQVTEDNCHYLFRLSFGSRQIMYRKIINHPYLIHLPLNYAGLPKVDNDLIEASGKFVVLDRMLKKLSEGGHKVLLFSTMKMILDVIEDYLSMRPWKYVRLDGEVNIETRKNHIHVFNSDPNYFLFLISTRAGGVGLNLAAADTVIIFDSDWNPQVDIQAMARCHRIGQTRPVVIYRLCTKGTFDEAIVSRAEAKRKLEKLVISKEIEEMTLFNKEGLLKLKELLDSSDQQVGNSGKEFLSEDELEKLLDRSDLEGKTEDSVQAIEPQK